MTRVGQRPDASTPIDIAELTKDHTGGQLVDSLVGAVLRFHKLRRVTHQEEIASFPTWTVDWFLSTLCNLARRSARRRSRRSEWVPERVSKWASARVRFRSYRG